MKKLTFAVLGAASLALAACSGAEDDTLEGAEENVQINELDALAENAAMDAEAELANEVDEVEITTEEEPTPVDENVTDPSQVEEDVQGM